MRCLQLINCKIRKGEKRFRAVAFLPKNNNTSMRIWAPFHSSPRTARAVECGRLASHYHHYCWFGRSDRPRRWSTADWARRWSTWGGCDLAAASPADCRGDPPHQSKECKSCWMRTFNKIIDHLPFVLALGSLEVWALIWREGKVPVKDASLSWAVDSTVVSVGDNDVFVARSELCYKCRGRTWNNDE